MNVQEPVRKYVSIDDIQREYLPVSKKKIRSLVKQYLPVKTIGGRMFVQRETLEQLLSDKDSLPLA